ncbi:MULTISPECIES: hypothetical protein [unclassified Streptomyces]|uniref:hypothetical protein n=1 Tax=unclassified Streptomyces TaxID=2593676 RepID=UPI001F5B3E58|nr:MULTISPECIES: hypothetical protein [unclassified Streptomyces]
MQVNSAEHHFAHAALRHYKDAVLLHDGARLSNADHHFGFAVECALKSLLLRFTTATMGPKPNGKPATKPWSMNPMTGAFQEHGHLPGLTTDVSLLTHGRSAASLTAALAGLSAFATWSVHDRYLDGSAVVEADVRQRRTVAENILALHEQALITGRMP